MVATLLGDAVPASLTVVGLAVALVVVNPVLALVTAALVPLLVGTYQVFRPARARARAVAAFHGAYERFSAEVLRLLRSDEMIRIHGAHDAAEAQQALRIRALEESGRRAIVLDAAHEGAQLFGVAVVATAILLIGGLLVTRGDLLVGELVSFYAAFGILRRPVSSSPARRPS